MQTRDAPKADAPPRWSLSSWEPGSLLRVGAAFLLTRLVLYVTGAIAIRMAPPDSVPTAGAVLGKNLSLTGWVRWDASWYLSITERGYALRPATARRTSRSSLCSPC